MSKHAQRGHSHSVRLNAWLAHHGESLMDALRRLLQRPIGSLLSMLVIAASLTIPITLLSTLHSARAGLAGWSNEAALLQLFLKPSVSEVDSQTLLKTLKEDPAIAEARLITPQEGLEQLARTHAIDGLLGELKDNPLPAVIEIHPKTAGQAGSLRDRLASLPQVDVARMDSETIDRLRSLIDTGEQLTIIFLAILAPALAITIGNTIRLELERRAHEVRLLQLIGATHAFIRRPLLYSGAMLGLGGTLLSLLLSTLAMDMLIEAAARSGWTMGASSNAPPDMLISLLPTGMFLGVVAAWMASALQIRRIRPG